VSFINITDPHDKENFPFLCNTYPVKNGKGMRGLKKHFMEDIEEAITNSKDGTEQFSLKVELRKVEKLNPTIIIGEQDDFQKNSKDVTKKERILF